MQISRQKPCFSQRKIYHTKYIYLLLFLNGSQYRANQTSCQTLKNRALSRRRTKIRSTARIHSFFPWYPNIRRERRNPYRMRKRDRSFYRTKRLSRSIISSTKHQTSYPTKRNRYQNITHQLTSVFYSLKNITIWKHSSEYSSWSLS